MFDKNKFKTRIRTLDYTINNQHFIEIYFSENKEIIYHLNLKTIH